jgi:putative DNA primase/helicase
VKEVDFGEAKVIAAEMIGRPELISERKPSLCSLDAASLLAPDSDNRNDDLAWQYLSRRLKVEPASVPRPTTKVVGIKSLPYFDQPRGKGSKGVHVGNFPAAIFETVDRDGARHAHRIYLAPGGVGKAELGLAADGTERDPKKSARKIGNERTTGRSVIWGDASKADTEIICEGIETAAAVAFAFQPEISSGQIMAAACISAAGIAAFKPWSAAKQVIVGADRDESSEDGEAPSRRGEKDAHKFARLHHSTIAISIALPGKPGEKIDWLEVLEREGVDAVRSGILAGQPFTATTRPEEKPPASFNAGDAAEIARLAKSSPFDYDRERVGAAKQLGCRVSTLDKQVAALRGETASAAGQGQPIELPEAEPWDVPVDGSELLTTLSSTIRQYVIVTAEQADAISLWSLHTHVHDAFDVSPMLVAKSAQKRSGKSRLAQVLERTVARRLLVSGISPAALLRIIEMYAPTLLLDEMDAAMKRDREMAEALRGIINSAFNRAGARFIMNVPTPGGGFEPRQFSTWATLLLSGIGDLPDTVRDRSIEIEMVRKRLEEKVLRLRRRDGLDLNVLGRKSARWARDNLDTLRDATPQIPSGLSDRAADGWEPLFAIADLAGGDWPLRARQAALALSGEHAKEDGNTATQLLIDIHAVFTTDKIKSETLVERLVALEGHEWAEYGPNGKPITQNKLARLLKPYKIRPKSIRFGPAKEDTAKGYELAQFSDVFERYLPDSYNQTVTPSQPNETGAFRESQSVTPSSDVTDEKAQNASNSSVCDGVTDESPLADEDAYPDLLPEEETTL